MKTIIYLAIFGLIVVYSMKLLVSVIENSEFMKTIEGRNSQIEDMINQK